MRIVHASDTHFPNVIEQRTKMDVEFLTFFLLLLTAQERVAQAAYFDEED
jgi:hypothetical protein